ncbi:uncharacterized protein [Aegilops tauschii subsp. strangulata]|uniref:uncharacterized protein n=1 Tax=Aegilops tauschii subsp. strangulata TaxID=200361 RepID=UPI00098A032C|nr:uncharacterized protein LOC109750601 [Aegilops tauschii subsp. strangulata]
MEKLGIKEKKKLLPNRTVFHGIVHGLSCPLIGKIKIDVQFGDKTHFRCEPIWFEMKMSGPKGIITIAGDYQKSLTCAAASSRLVESLVIAEEKHLLDRAVAMASEQPTIPSDPKDAEYQGSFQPAMETKKIALDPAHPE